LLKITLVKNISLKNNLYRELLVEYGSELWEPKKRRGRYVVDTGESTEFVLHHQLSKDAWAATFTVRVTCSAGKAWTRSVTLTNKLE
jgi:hypothetical protein